MNRRTLANVDTSPTDTGIQRRRRSFLTSDRAAARLQPTMSARGTASAGPLQGQVEAGHRDR
jgi:hypothetical protein